MLKSVLFCVMALFTGIRFINIIYMLVFRATYLPLIAFALMSVIVLYGMFLIAKKFIFGIRLKEIVWFFMAQAAVAAFNLGYLMFIGYPLRLSLLEIITVGTFFDLLIAACVLYYSAKQMRHRPARETENMHV